MLADALIGKYSVLIGRKGLLGKTCFDVDVFDVEKAAGGEGEP